MSISGQTAVVTGAGTGIGKGIAVELAKRGVQVMIHYNSSDAGAKDTLSRIEEVGGVAAIVQANASSHEEIRKMMHAAAERFGSIDILVNNAALQLNFDFLEYKDSDFERLMNVNLKGYWQCMQEVVPYMKAKGRGRIINISSVHGKRPTDFDVLYAMTKGGIRMLGRESAIELAQYGITVNTIEPGAVYVGKQGNKETKPIGPPNPEDEAERLRKLRLKFPLGRVGLPSDVASMVCYLASDESEFMTGSAIRMDGGSMLL